MSNSKFQIVPSKSSLFCGSGIEFGRIVDCKHNCAFSSRSLVGCNFCNFMLRLFNFFKSNKIELNRNSLSRLGNIEFDKLFNIACFLFKIKFTKEDFIDNAESFISGGFGHQYDCSLSIYTGANTQDRCDPDCWSICNNAQHLFECSSSSDQTRGEYFSIPRASRNWHATCKKCGASCCYATPREGVILALFFLQLRVRYTGHIYLVGLQSDCEWSQCSRSFAMLVMSTQGSYISFKNLEIKNTDPEFVSLNSDVFLGSTFDEHIDFGVVCSSRLAKDSNVIANECECAHEFFLTSCSGFQLALTTGMLRTLLMLMPSHGYMNGGARADGDFVVNPTACGLYNVGGFQGVHLRCNLAFTALHELFYNGPFVRGGVAPIDALGFDELHNAEAHAGSSSQETEYEGNEYTEDEVDLDQLLLNFKNSDSNMLDIESQTFGSTTRGLSLRKRVGGLLKGVTNCVSKLHTIWDWPLDKATDILNEVGDWMEKNQEYTSKDVWSCQSCPELSKDVQKAIGEQGKVNELLKVGLNKLATTLDSVTSMNKTNLEEIERKLQSLENKLDEAGRNKSSPDVDLEGFYDNVNRILALYKDLKEKVDSLSSGKKPTRVRPSPGLVGEQMEVPKDLEGNILVDNMDPVKFNKPQAIKQYGRSSMVVSDPILEKVVKHSGLTEIVAEIESAKSIPSSVVESTGKSEEHNIMLSKFHLSSFTWNVSDGENVVLKNFSMPEDIWNGNPSLRNIVSCFQYYNCEGFKFTVSTTSVGMQGGTLMVNWDALSCATQQKIDSVMQLSNLPCAFIHASESTTQVFEIQSPSIQHIMCTSGSEASLGALGTFKISIANVLNAASETSQSVNINVWVEFLRPKISFRTVPHEIVLSQSFNVDNLAGLAHIEAIVAMGKWTTTSSKDLLSLTVHPTACHVSEGLVTQTSLSVLSSLFARWRGSLVYKIVFGASLFVKGKIAVCAIPVAFRNKSMTMAQMLSFPSTICDLTGGQREFTFVVPYISVGLNSLVNRDALYDISSYNADLVVSRLHFKILDPLVMNANASNSISYFVTVAPGRDFSLSQLAGIKAEFVDRNIKQSFGQAQTFSKLVGSGFSDLCSISSIVRKFTLNAADKNAFYFMVAPCFRNMPPCSTTLSWLTQLFVEWSGSLVYTLRAHSHERQNSSYFRVWYDCNGSPRSGEESEFLSDVDPPAGVKVYYWRPSETPEMVFTVPYCARTPKLILPKARMSTTAFDWLRCYNGSIIVDYEGKKDVKVELSIAGGPDFEMYEQTVAPRCGKVSKAFTVLSYEKKLKDITDFPLNNERLGGPVNKAIVTPNKFAPIAAVTDVPRARSGPKEGDRSIDQETGEPIVFVNGEWIFEDEDEVTAQAGNCFDFGASEARAAFRELNRRETCSKVADIVDAGHTLLTDGDMSRKILEATELIVPLLEKAKDLAGNLEEKMITIDTYKSKIMDIVKGLLGNSIPGLLSCAIDNEQYVWATMLTLLGGTSLVWVCKSRKSYIKKLAIFCMIIWSPLIKDSIWKLGAWIRKNASNIFYKVYNRETCRKHSLAGMFEGVKETFGNFSEWFSGNWAESVQGLLSLLGVVASLVVWAKIPDEKQLKGFASKFREAGNKGKNFSNVFGGFSSIKRMSDEWSKKFVSWLMSVSGSSLPKSDSALQQLLSFDIRSWVEETREMALQENRFTGFGSDEHLVKVRHLYDRSVEIQRALLDGVKVDMQLGLIIKECKTKCDELLNDTYSFKGMKQSRIDPIHVCVIGKPGVGKSTISHIMINDLLDHRGEPVVDRIYTRCCADAYWSNYHQEPVILYDDLGAIKSNLKLSDYAEIMGVKTNDPFSVPMAAVEDKGKHCTSRYVFSCTNILHLDDSGDVVTKSAYYRRRNVLVEVDRDMTVERDEENPTRGLLFTVKGGVITGDPNQVIEFDVKRNWDESFLSGIDTTDWVFDKVDYKTFLRFLCVYTDAYMASQEKLMKGIKSFKCNPFENVVEDAEGVVAHGGKVKLTLEEAISIFDNRKLPGKEFSKIFENSSYRAPDSWRTGKPVCFRQLMAGLCDCGKGRSCLFDLNFKHLLELIPSHGNRSGFVLDRLSRIPEETTFIVENSSFCQEENPLAVFIALATYYKWSVPTGMCYYQYFGQKVSPLGGIAKPRAFLEIMYEDGVSDLCVEDAVQWESVEKFFPDIYRRVKCVPIFTDRFLFLTVDPTLPLPKPQASSEWKNVWNFGFSNKVDAYDLLSSHDRDVIKCIVKDIGRLGTFDNPGERVKEAVKQIKLLYGEGPVLYTFMLILAEEHSKQLEADERDSIEKRNFNVFKVPERLLAYEREIENGLSTNAKIALSVGAGIVAAGAIVGLYFGFKALLNMVKSDDTTSAVEAEAEFMGAHESDMFQTSHVRTRNQKPRMVVRTLEPHVSGAHESDMFQTRVVHQHKEKPKIRATPEAGLGVTYSDVDDLRTHIRVQKRKNLRKGVQEAVKQAFGAKGVHSEVLGRITNWQRKVKSRGVHIGSQEKRGALKKIHDTNFANGESQQSHGNLLVGDPEFIKDADTDKLISKLVSLDVVEHRELITEGTQNVTTKQAQVGDYGLVRDVNMVNLLQTHISKMSCTVLKIRGEECRSYGVLRLKGTFVLAPAHYIEDFLESDEFYFICPHKVVKIPFVPSHVSLVSDIQDLIVWNLGNTVPPSIDYTCHIPTNEDWKHFRKTSGVLSLTKYSQSMTLQIVHALDTIELTSADVETPTGAYEIFETTHTVISGLRYRVHCMPGFCGAAILRADTRNVRKVIGMHVAGQKSAGVGYAETLTLEPIMEAIQRIDQYIVSQSTKSLDVPTCEKQSISLPGKGNLGLVGRVDPKYVPNVPTKTTIAKSIIHGLIGEVKTEPSILSKWDKRLGEKRMLWDPVLEAVKKYGVATHPFHPHEIKMVAEHLSSVFLNFNNTLNKREVNNLDVGINGIDLSDYWSQIEMKTSAGYPYVLRKPSGASGKEWLFKRVGEYSSGKPQFEMSDSELIESYTSMENAIKVGEVPSIITMECPKDERRKLKKIYEEPATRTFTILPPEINILFRMYFGDFAAMVMSTRFNHFSQVGINPESMEWSELMNSFLAKGSRGFAGDYAKFDGVGSAEIYHSIVDVVNSWYDDGFENARARHCLISSIIHRDGIANDIILRYSQGMPSGFSMTVIFNSFVNYYYMALAWMDIVSNSVLSPQADLCSFDYFTRIIVYGDDNVVVVSSEFLDIYNLRTVASYLSEYGITYTDDAKNPIHLSEPHVDITSVTFLKRSFVKVDKSGNLWKAPLDKTSIEERCNWIRECEIPVEALMQNVESALFEASIHGEAYFNELKGRIDSALDRVVLPKSTETFRKCNSRWWSNMTGAIYGQTDLSNLVELSKKNQIDLSYKFKDVLVGNKLSLGDALHKAKSAPLVYFSV
ncbi:TPA_asm: polyprotein [Thapsia villosa waikavirus]|uniref:Genome polyprotein n=1 Tax=Thapsia villosa waikavirus TaxID=3027351 RepID=A0AA48SFM6_9SECO|nr:TPA_asm: polyprotein [Thapsia villosa waikavirus]